jgi:hypothetical protein
MSPQINLDKVSILAIVATLYPEFTPISETRLPELLTRNLGYLGY